MALISVQCAAQSSGSAAHVRIRKFLKMLHLLDWAPVSNEDLDTKYLSLTKEKLKNVCAVACFDYLLRSSSVYSHI